jgi:hypothetical protein
MDKTIDEIMAKAPSLRRFGLRVLLYDVGDGNGYAFSINGISVCHIGVQHLEDDLQRLAAFASSEGICIQVEIDIAADPDGNDDGLEIMSEAESGSMQTWLENVGFNFLGETPSGLSARIGVDARPRPSLRPH